MTPGTFIKSWPYFAEEVYLPLAAIEEDGPPNDMFSEIGKAFMGVVSDRYNQTVEHIDQKIKDSQGVLLAEAQSRLLETYKGDMQAFEESLSGIQEYEQQFQAVDKLIETAIPTFMEESDLINFVEEIHELIAEYNTAWANIYKEYVSRFIWKYGLGYEICEPFEVRPLISCEFTRFYQALKEVEGNSGDLQDLLRDFEHAYALFVRHEKPEDLNNALKSAFSYLEGMTGEKLGNRGKNFGDLVKQCERNGLFPHKGSVAGSISKLYGFSSDYPRLRHPGNPRSKIRDLTENDCVALSMMALLWAGYINELPLLSPDERTQEKAA